MFNVTFYSFFFSFLRWVFELPTFTLSLMHPAGGVDL
jgi:hypothetical protein